MHVESFLVCIVGKMAHDVGWCECVVVSFPSCLAGFLGFHPYMRLFSLGKLFCDLYTIYCVQLAVLHFQTPTTKSELPGNEVIMSGTVFIIH